MADYTISLTQPQEDALQAQIDRENRGKPPADQLTKVQFVQRELTGVVRSWVRDLHTGDLKKVEEAYRNDPVKRTAIKTAAGL